MRVFWLIIWIAFAGGCSSYGVRCDSRLHPINILETKQGAPHSQAGKPRGKP
jgi:hypothetical protein